MSTLPVFILDSVQRPVDSTEKAFPTSLILSLGDQRYEILFNEDTSQSTDSSRQLTWTCEVPNGQWAIGHGEIPRNGWTDQQLQEMLSNIIESIAKASGL